MLSAPLAKLRHWRAGRVWLRNPRRAIGLLDAGPGAPRGEALGLRAWLALIEERDDAGAERRARDALAQRADSRFAPAALAEVLLRQNRHDEAVQVLRAARSARPQVPWYALSLADALEEGGRLDEAVELLEAAAGRPPLRRHAVKRLSRLALQSGDRERALRWYGELVGLAPDYLVYASDYETLGRLQLDGGDREAARETWRAGAAIYARHAGLRRLRHEHFGEDEPLATPRIAPVSEAEEGVQRIPVRTPMISSRTGLLEVIDPATREARRSGDVLAVAESAAAAGQGRLVPLELILPGRLARFLSRFVGAIGPLHSAEGMEGAIMEAGRPRIMVAAVIGGLTRPLGRSGWFYRIAGPRTAMIDDVAACMPPHDHHVIFGPLDPERLAGELARALGCEVGVVDANHRTGAWVVGASPGTDARWLAQALRDNPAGNEDEQTPVVIVRRAGAPAGRAAAAVSG